jgi:hypothetical protein
MAIPRLHDDPERLRDPAVRALLHDVDTEGLRRMLRAVAKQDPAIDVPDIRLPIAVYRATVTAMVLTGEISVDIGQDLTRLVEAILKDASPPGSPLSTRETG